MAVIKIDFTGATDGFKNVNKPGVYTVKITKVEAKKGADSGNPYLNWEMVVVKGEAEGAKLWLITSLMPKALFNLRNLLIAAGLEVPKSMVKIDLDTVLNRIVDVKVKMGEYKGEPKAEIKEVMKATFTSGNSEFDTDDEYGGEPNIGEEPEDFDAGDIDLTGLDL